jgi:hypothetical protein
LLGRPLIVADDAAHIVRATGFSPGARRSSGAIARDESPPRAVVDRKSKQRTLSGTARRTDRTKRCRLLSGGLSCLVSQ